MYVSSYTIFKNQTISLLSTIIYTLNYYSIWTLHVRLALGEVAAFAFLPLLIAGIYNLYFNDKKKWHYIVIGATLVAETHVLTAFYTAFLVLIISLIFIKKIINDKEILKKLLISIALIVLLNIGFYYPMIMSYISEKHLFIYTMKPAQMVGRSIITVFRKIPFMSGESSMLSDYGFTIDQYASFSVLEFVFLLFFIIYILLRVIRKKVDKYDKIALLFFAIFIYHIIAYIGALSHTGIKALDFYYAVQQFGFRELGRGTPFFSMMIAYALYKSYGERKVIIVVMMIILFLSGSNNILRRTFDLDEDFKIMDNSYSIVEKGKESWLYNSSIDYAPIEIYNESDYSGNIEADGADISNGEFDYLKMSCDYIKEREDASITFPLFKYRGYEAMIDGEPIEIDKNSYVVKVNLTNAKNKGNLLVEYIKPFDYLVAFYISLLAYILLMLSLLYKKIKVKK